MKPIFKPPIWVVLMALLCLHTQVKAQEEGKEQKMKRYEWEVATNIMPLFFANNRSPYSSFIRKNFIRLKNKRLIKRAYRVGFDFDSRLNNYNLNRTNTLPYSSFSENFSDVTYISLRLGYEWQFHFQKFHFYYGYEVYGTYRREFFDVTNSTITSLDVVVYRKSDAFSLGFRGLGGVKYFIHPRFAVSAETGLSLAHFKENINYKRREMPDVLSEYSYHGSMNIMGYSPLMNINLSVLF